MRSKQRKKKIISLIISISYIFKVSLFGDSLLGFLVDSYDTVWYMIVQIYDFTPCDRCIMYRLDRLTRVGLPDLVALMFLNLC
jgi:hypothetical protein